MSFLIEEFLEEHHLPYHLKDVILVSRTGAGKMVLIDLAIFVLQKEIMLVLKLGVSRYHL